MRQRERKGGERETERGRFCIRQTKIQCVGTHTERDRERERERERFCIRQTKIQCVVHV